VSLADDFWVLGSVLPRGGGAFEIIHPGRYLIAPLARSGISGGQAQDAPASNPTQDEDLADATLDGAPLSNGRVEMKIGLHRLQTSRGCRPAVVWIGPRRDRACRLDDRGHRMLFFNWY
jgi:hypothetical protein